jgi:acetyl/propionyl-CoA carboxylase alpha subunit
MSHHFNRILIANRGEIAIRIARTCADMGIASVAVFAEDDQLSLHTKRADTAHPLKGSGVAAYLDIEQLISIAKQHDCDAIHPGYGFLSENAKLAQRCSEEGICFIGAPTKLLNLLGNKASARQAAQANNIPMVQGLNRICSLADIQQFHRSLGKDAAIMIKALAGGGGRGMKTVTKAEDIEPAYQQCQSEAKLAFGCGDLYVEQLVQRARHIEIQVLGDGSGDVTHLWERECTLQRRNQKLIEIAPSPTLDASTRTPVINAALRLASALKYKGLGTFEFLLDADNLNNFYFMEVNPRIQVEHTVTEEITGLDLVALQIQLAANTPLGELGLNEPPPIRGTAIQARINLESMQPDASSHPAAGSITAYHAPSGHGIRVDDYIYNGYPVSPRYDSLAAKLIVTAGNYRAALEKLSRSLSEFQLEGVNSNKTFLLNLIDLDDVKNNLVNTRLVENQAASLLQTVNRPSLHFDTTGKTALHTETPPIPKNCEGLRSPTAGLLISIAVAEGEAVHQGQTIAIVEAMKMEFPLKASCNGVIQQLSVTPGSIITEEQVLAVIQPTEADSGHSPQNTEIDLDYIRPDLADMQERHARISDERRPQATAKRHAKGKRTARENIADLLDDGSFNEYGALAVAAQRKTQSLDTLIDISPADGLITGTGSINGDLFSNDASRCAALAYDYTVMAGTQGIVNHHKTDRLLSLAKQWRLPLVLFAEGGGGRPSDSDFCGVGGLDLNTFAAMAELSGLVPTVGIAAGRCFAGNAALFGVCDVTIATLDATLGMAGPVMIEGAGLGSFNASEVGPVSVQAPNGVIDIVVENEADAVATAKQYLSYFQGDLAEWKCHDQRRLRHAIPENRKQIYDIREVIENLADVDSVLELRSQFAPGAITALVRIEGKAFGLYANNPAHLGGAIDADSADKIARFLQLCDAHDLPVISLCDTPGFMVGPESEKQATIRHVSRIFVNSASLSVPIFTLILRKGYGLGAMAMAAGGFHTPVFSAAWPSGEFGAMGVEGAVHLVAGKHLASLDDPEERQSSFNNMVEHVYREGKALNAASYLEIDAVIDPMESRRWLLRGLATIPKAPSRTGKKRPCIDTW